MAFVVPDASPAIERCLTDLQRDKERHRARPLPLSQNRTIELSDDSDDEHGQRLSPKSHLQKAGRKLWNVQRMGFVNGVRSRHLLQFGTFKNKCTVRSKDHELFLTRMLNYTPLMAKITSIMQKFRKPLFSIEEWDKKSLFNLVTQSLHDAKKVTVHVAWWEHVKPLNQQLTEMSIKYDALKAKFREARTSYLEEVSALRDSVRVRGDPLAGTSLDVAWFYEPTKAMEHEERKFLLGLLREKIKMMFETNPKVAKTFDFGQMERLMDQVESTEMSRLRESLKKKQEEITSLKQALAGNYQQPEVTEKQPQSKLQDGMIDALSAQLEEVRNQRDEYRHDLHLRWKDIECLQTERDEFAAELRSNSAERMMFQEECEHLRVISSEAEERIAEFEQTVQEQDSKIKSMEESLRRTVDRLRSYENNTITPIPRSPAPKRKDVTMESSRLALENEDGKVLNSGYGNGPGRRLPRLALEADAAAGKQATLSTIDLSFDKASSLKPVPDIPRDEDEVNFLRQKCAKLQQLVQLHMKEQSRNEMQEASEEANHLAILADSLGVSHHIDLDNVSQGARVCKCGNLLMDDSNFCRKCGSEWVPDGGTRRQAIVRLSLKLGDIAAQLESAIKNLGNELQQKQEDPNRAGRIIEAEKKVTRLKREQKGYETQLLVESTMDNFAEMATMSHLETCKCNCFQELEVTRDLLRQLRALCAEMAVKIKQATEDNVQLNSALDSTLVSLVAAKKLIGRSKAMQGPNKDQDLSMGLAALAEAEHNAVFHRLFNPNSETKNKWKERREKLMRDSANALSLKFVLDSSPEAVTPPLSPLASPPKRQSRRLDASERVGSDSPSRAGLIITGHGASGNSDLSSSLPCGRKRSASPRQGAREETDLADLSVVGRSSASAKSIGCESDCVAPLSGGNLSDSCPERCFRRSSTASDEGVSDGDHSHRGRTSKRLRQRTQSLGALDEAASLTVASCSERHKSTPKNESDQTTSKADKYKSSPESARPMASTLGQPNSLEEGQIRRRRDTEDELDVSGLTVRVNGMKPNSGMSLSGSGRLPEVRPPSSARSSGEQIRQRSKEQGSREANSRPGSSKSGRERRSSNPACPIQWVSQKISKGCALTSARKSMPDDGSGLPEMEISSMSQAKKSKPSSARSGKAGRM